MNTFSDFCFLPNFASIFNTFKFTFGGGYAALLRKKEGGMQVLAGPAKSSQTVVSFI